MESEDIMEWLMLIALGIMTGYVWWLNRKLNYLLKNQVVGTIILNSLKGVVDADEKPKD